MAYAEVIRYQHSATNARKIYKELTEARDILSDRASKNDRPFTEYERDVTRLLSNMALAAKEMADDLDGLIVEDRVRDDEDLARRERARKGR